MVTSKHSLLSDVYCTADGCKLYFETIGLLVEQGKFYNGWKSDHFVTNLFLFGADGRIIKCVLNVPGSLHDSTLAEWGGVYEKLEEVYNATGRKCCVDSAFTAANNSFMIKSGEDITGCEDAEEVMVKRQATSLRQASEWV
jgi:hypothetical protein